MISTGEVTVAGVLVGRPVEVVMGHVRQSAALVIPVAAVRAAEAMALERPQGGRAAVHVPVEVGGDWIDLVLDHAAPLLDFDSAVLDEDRVALFQQSALEDLADFLVRPETPVCADLEDSAVAPLGLGHGRAFGDETAHWLLAEHVFAGFHGGNGDEGVPAGVGGDGHHVDVLAFQHFAEIGIDPLVVGGILELHVAAGELADVVAQSAKGAVAASSAADQGAAQSLAGRQLVAAAFGSFAQYVPGHDGHGRRGRGRSLQEVSPGNLSLVFVHG